MKKIWKKVKDLMVQITFSTSREFDRLKSKVKRNPKKESSKKTENFKEKASNSD